MAKRTPADDYVEEQCRLLLRALRTDLDRACASGMSEIDWAHRCMAADNARARHVGKRWAERLLKAIHENNVEETSLIILIKALHRCGINVVIAPVMSEFLNDADKTKTAVHLS